MKRDPRNGSKRSRLERERRFYAARKRSRELGLEWDGGLHFEAHPRERRQRKRRGDA